MTVDKLVSEITDITQYDVLIIGQMSWIQDPPKAYNDLRISQPFCKLVHDADSAGLNISASCAGVCVLAASGILNGRTITGRNGTNDICRLRDDICSTSDGNYLISGTTSSKGLGVEDLYALKIDEEGTVIWEKTFGGSKPDTGSDVLETSDGFYLFGGSTSTFDNPPSSGRNRDMFVVKTNSDGILVKSEALWVMAASQGAYDACNSLCELADGDFAAVGICSREGVEPGDIGVIRLTIRDILQHPEL